MEGRLFLTEGVLNSFVVKWLNTSGATTYAFYFIFIFIWFFFETKGRQDNTKAQEAVDHLTSFLLSREEISQSGIEPPTSSFRFG